MFFLRSGFGFFVFCAVLGRLMLVVASYALPWPGMFGLIKEIILQACFLWWVGTGGLLQL